jgi:hypothetical protein
VAISDNSFKGGFGLCQSINELKVKKVYLFQKKKKKKEEEAEEEEEGKQKISMALVFLKVPISK